ncbi:MAG TPA: 2-oxo acid dehydrogenase subunit E2 [Candidatus Dormibacteraeota bacterium]|nr:2-oxo acid dehydrogenase subunit E2 [Candidatus Dormibacteraeota bacterium]
MDFQLPKLADTLVEGTVARWLKKPGERVSRGEALVEVETDKVNSELESPVDGVVTEILVAEGETAPVGAVLARISDDVEAPSAKLAGKPATEPPAASGGGLSSMRRRIAERTQEARATIPQGACVREFDLSATTREGGWTAYFVKALAAASGKDAIGVAVEVPGGLVVPVVREARRRSPAEISEAIADLAQRARENRLQPAEVAGGEFTVTNVGGGGALMAFPLVNPGQPGILAPGAVRDGRCLVTLCYDRRAYDDWAADRLLARVGEELATL